MKSHQYEFTPTAAFAALAMPVTGVLVVTLLLHGLATAGWMPPPLPVRDMDRTVLWHQIKASRSPSEVVLVGDSSCLMNVSGAGLQARLGRPVRNLGAMSLLDLASFGTLASNAVSAGTRPAVVVLLVHPEFLLRPAGDSRYLALFGAFLEGGPEPVEAGDFAGGLESVSGITLFRDHLETRLRPFPLLGEFRRTYGYNRNLAAAMDADGGSLADPRTYINRSSTHAAPVLSPRIEAQAAVFRKLIPSGTGIYVGITPIPESEAVSDYGSRHAQALTRLASWLGPDVVPLDELPAFLPDDGFATRTHLSESGRAAYTRRVSDALTAAGLRR